MILGDEKTTIWPVAQTVYVGRNLGGAPIGNVIKPMVNVNVYSAGTSTQKAPIDCSLVDGPSDALLKATQEITCKLFGG